MVIRSASVRGLALLAGLASGPALAQDENPTTPGAIPNPGTYQGSMQLQQQEQQQYQQQQQQNQQMQQRLDRNYQQNAPRQGGGRQASGPPPINWWSKPALPPDRNPLLGHWHQIASRQAQNPFASLLGGMMAGGCQSIFGKGVVAFEPNALQWVAPDGHEEILNHVAYRTNGQGVVVISRDPGAIPALIFGFPNRDHAVVAGLNCSMERAGASVASAGPAGRSPAPRSGSYSQPRSQPPPTTSAKAVLNFDIGAATPGQFAPFAGIQIWVTHEDPGTSLRRAGIPQEGPLVSRLIADCHVPANCVRDWKAMTSTALGSIRTDAAGHAHTPSIPAGRYHLVGMAPYHGKVLFWSQAVNLQAGSNSVMLDQTNGQLFQ